MKTYFKNKPWRSPKYLAFIRKQPCVVTRQTPCEPHHVKTKTNHGMGRKPSDFWCLPVTREAHLKWEKETNEHMEKTYYFNVYEELFSMVSKYLKEIK